jgi:hypothetical protein
LVQAVVAVQQPEKILAVKDQTQYLAQLPLQVADMAVVLYLAHQAELAELEVAVQVLVLLIKDMQEDHLQAERQVTAEVAVAVQTQLE